MFNEKSIVANTWAKVVRNGTKKIEEVPNIDNLREIVLLLIEGGE